MLKKVKNLLFSRKVALMRAVVNFINEERGASNMVEVIILIAIVIAVAAIFRTQLIDLINSVFEQLTEFVGG